ncbi:MAG TPA: DUF2807 domain-containing protein [Lutibacter sp.]|nr:DUF2807 domain-containing protein [Lutibacter sp.]
MKTITLTFVLLLSFNLTAQSWFGKKIIGNGKQVTIERIVADYEEINIAGAFEVELVKGTEGNLSIEIEENLQDYLVTKLKGETLIIRWKQGFKVRPKHTVHIIIPFIEIEGVNLAGSGKVKSTDSIATQEFEIELAGSGTIDLKLNTEEVDCSMAGSGSVILKGNTNDFDCSKAGSGNLDSYGFKCENIDISSAGSGSAEVFVSYSLVAQTAGSGSIYYKGDPKDDTLKVAGSGRILMK